MRGEHTIEEQVEQMKEYLGCPCTYYPPSDDCQPMISARPVPGEKRRALSP